MQFSRDKTPIYNGENTLKKLSCFSDEEIAQSRFIKQKRSREIYPLLL